MRPLAMGALAQHPGYSVACLAFSDVGDSLPGHARGPAATGRRVNATSASA